ncbi:GNAT family N-acetyltransferase [Actinocorallia sp. API 0066]|uniref:GNAT family N-acetyltransferase n=1 Tax=Actinocorallia sp. API 0066 TaxID=2896846 RepID=UPI001E295ABD|nr:GNAT family protein [Actinocorallia sp. API 0066]MCD0452762.1 GNAT family N-acetyltransferase [Actinocorallia sp. API 0066]
MAPILADLPWPRRTDRLVLRPAVPADAEPTWRRYRRLPEIRWWLSGGDADFTSYLAKYSDPARLAATLIVEHEGTIIGDLMLRVDDLWTQPPAPPGGVPRQAEIGWALAPSAQGNGFASESARELLRIAFADPRLHRVTAVCFTGNTPSWRLMERLGMRREQHSLKDALHTSGELMDSYMYAMLAEEWRPER